MLEIGIKEIWLDVNGLYTHCLTAGESGSPVILVHSAGDSATLSWSDAIKPLSTHHRIFAPDLPGYGLSDKPEGIQHTTDFYYQDRAKHTTPGYKASSCWMVHALTWWTGCMKLRCLPSSLPAKKIV